MKMYNISIVIHSQKELQMINYDDDTSNLLNKLNSARTDKEFDDFIKENTEIDMKFSNFFSQILERKEMTVASVIRAGGMDSKYPYQIINGNKKSPGRNKVLCLCIGAQMNISETNRALELTNNAALYPKNTKDAIIIKHINREDWSVANINSELHEYGVNDLLG